MTDILTISKQQQQQAQKLINTLQITNIWQSSGATINLIGSLKLGLLAKHRDIDFHIYTKELDIKQSFQIISKICQNSHVKKCEFNNLSDTDESCFEWHIWAEDDNSKLWQIDMIQIKQGSTYDGYFEKMADNIALALTDETRHTILKLKFETPDNIKISGIEYYKAVIQDGVKSFDELLKWQQTHSISGIIEW